MIINNVKLSSEFKSKATKAILAIVLFIIVYIVLIGLAIRLTILSIYAGIKIIKIFPRIHTIILGIGMASIGVFVLIFLIKFIFKTYKTDLSGLYEINEDTEPELFQLINKVVKKVGSRFPKKVYLTNEVNAAVFYDSSFLSMFLPIKKNLQIGLGLINSVTKSELEAILGHEFGHFSQKTMKVGSYVYTVNQIIYNLIYENETYDKIIQRWSKINGYFSLFVSIAYLIISGIQMVLKLMYGIVNINYLGLSREMEFHADEIAAKVAGKDQMINALLRIDLSAYSLNSVFTFYENNTEDKLISENIYDEQLFVMNFIAKHHNLPIKNSLPEVVLNDITKFNKSKLTITDQWASHPSLEERIKRLSKINIKKEIIDQEPANNLLKNHIKLQKELTKKHFNQLTNSSKTTKLSIDEFIKTFNDDLEQNILPEIYNGYYEDKNPLYFTIENQQIFKDKSNSKLSDLFSDEMVDLVNSYNGIVSDKTTIEQIEKKQIKIRTFDYDGVKSKRKDCQHILA